MSGFPLFSNFEPFVKEQLDKRKDNTLEVSSYTTWTRLFSSAGKGLIMYSNPTYALFKAAGESSISTIYGGMNTSGVLGVDWDGNPVYAEDDVPLKPSPVVTSFDVDEGMGNISRRANLSITAYTKGQADLLAEYFMEPGFTVFFEWGRNVPESMNSIINTEEGSDDIATQISKMQNFEEVLKKRTKSDGNYDNYLGFIKGANMSIGDEQWTITVELVGLNEIPYWMQNRDVVKEDGNEIPVAEKFDNVERERDAVKKRFKIMFNDLPSNRRTSTVKQLINEVKGTDLINFDEDIINEINNTKKKGIRARGVSKLLVGETRDIFGADYGFMFRGNNNPDTIDDVRRRGMRLTDNNNNEWTVIDFGTATGMDYIKIQVTKLGNVKTDEVGYVEITDGIKVINSERFISMKLAMRILELNAESLILASGDSKINFNIDIEDTTVKAFKNIFSTDRSKLFIPNSNTPAFTIGAASRGVPLTLDVLKGSVVNNLIRYDGEDDIVMFPELKKLLDKETEETLKYPTEWGYLKNLYINFDFFKRTVDVKTFAISDILKTLLNGLSDAVSSYWDFQIVEREDEDKNMTLQIVDMKLVPKTETDDDATYEFMLFGDKTVFLSNSFTMDIPASMANKIMASRLADKPDINPSKTTTGLFTDKEDKIIRKIKTKPDNEDNNEDDTEDREFSIGTYLGNVGIYPNPAIIRADDLKEVDGKWWNPWKNTELYPLDDIAIYATYNDVQLLSNTEKRTTSTTEEISTLLPLTFSFSIHGLSGIKRGDKFRVIGLPDIFTRKAFFQVTSIKHNVDSGGWKTEVEGRLRRAL